ncbi:MAG: AAA family ATPase [Flavipsychrobacter sp.]
MKTENEQHKGFLQRLDIKTIKDNVDKLLDSMPYKERNSLFIIKDGNQWMEDAHNMPIPTMLFSELWHEGELCILFADTNVGKSILAVQIADSISKGMPIMGMKLEAKAQPVVYFDFELFQKQFEARYSIDYQKHYRFHNNFYRAELHPDMELMNGCRTFEECLMMSLEAAVQETGAKVLVIDNLTYLRHETEQARDALPLMKELKAFKLRFSLSILALAHTPKRDQSKPIGRNDLQGSKMLINFCDSSFCIGESNKTQGMRYIKQIKARNTEIVYHSENVLLCIVEKPSNFLQFAIMGTGEEREHLKTKTDDSDKAYLIQRCKEMTEEGWSQRHIASELGVGLATVNRYLKAS